MHQVECIGWSALGGVHQVEYIGWCASGGVHQVQCIRWSASGGVHWLECISRSYLLHWGHVWLYIALLEISVEPEITKNSNVWLLKYHELFNWSNKWVCPITLKSCWEWLVIFTILCSNNKSRITLLWSAIFAEARLLMSWCCLVLYLNNVKHSHITMVGFTVEQAILRACYSSWYKQKVRPLCQFRGGDLISILK